MCLVCYSHFLYLYKIIVIQSFALRYKESPPSVFTLAPDDKYIKYTMDKAMYLVDETGLAQYNTLKEFFIWDYKSHPESIAALISACQIRNCGR